METLKQQNVELPGLVTRYVTQVQKSNPSVKVLVKKNSKLMQLIGKFFKATNISPNFMEQYYTTIGSTLYVPDSALTTDPVYLLNTIMHECLHATDSKRWSLLFSLSYLAPQIFALFALLAVFAFLHPLMALWLIALVFLAPFPAPARYYWELRAYRTTILFCRKVYGYSDADMEPVYEWVVGQLATKLYYFAWPFPEKIKRDLKDESFMSETEYKQMFEFLKREKLLFEQQPSS
jgi:hypothetical protein